MKRRMRARIGRDQRQLRARLAAAERAAQAREREVDALQRIAALALPEQPLRAALQVAAQEVSACTGFPIVAIELYDEALQLMELVAAAGLPLAADPLGPRVPVGQTLSGLVARSGQALIETHLQDRPERSDASLCLLGVQAYVCVPLSLPGQVIGTLALAHPDAIQPDAQIVPLARRLAKLIAVLITRKQAEAALRHSEGTFRTFYEHTRDAFVSVGMDGKICQYNHSFQELLGYSAEELAHLTYRDITPEQWHELEERIVQEEVLPQGFSAPYEKEYRRKDGALIPIELRTMLIVDEQGQPAQMWAIIRDITARKAAEAALRDLQARRLADEQQHAARLQQLYAQEQAARAQAEEASRLKDEFLAIVSHELRTPLAAFLGYAQLLQRRRRDEAYIDRTVAKMVQSAKVQAALIEDLLDVSRLVGGKLRIEPAPIALVDVVQAALDTIRPTVEAKGLHLQAELDPAASPVLGDASRLQQVVWNLLANAAKFTPGGGRITVRLAPVGGQAEISVGDSGQGIRAELLPYVFDRFRQGDSSSQRAHGGLGLGLAIVRHLVELHGGTVAATSAGEGQGATFTVRLPLAGWADVGAEAGPGPRRVSIGPGG